MAGEKDKQRQLNSDKAKDKAAAQGQEGDEPSAASSDKNDEGSKKGRRLEFGLIGGILFGLFFMGSVAIDALPLFSAGLSSALDWTLDTCLGIFGVITFLVITGDPFESLTSRNAGANFLGWILEILPGPDWLPIHIAIAVIIWLNFKYNILSFKKNIGEILEKIPTK